MNWSTIRRVLKPRLLLPGFLRCKAIFFVSNFLHPLDHFAVQSLFNGDVRHRGRRCGAVPMFLVRRKPDDIARADLLDRPTFTLRPTKAGGNNQRLTERMRMPCGASTGLKRHARATDACRFSRFEQRIDAHSSREPIS